MRRSCRRPCSCHEVGLEDGEGLELVGARREISLSTRSWGRQARGRRELRDCLSTTERTHDGGPDALLFIVRPGQPSERTTSASSSCIPITSPGRTTLSFHGGQAPRRRCRPPPTVSGDATRCPGLPPGDLRSVAHHESPRAVVASLPPVVLGSTVLGSGSASEAEADYPHCRLPTAPHAPSRATKASSDDDCAHPSHWDASGRRRVPRPRGAARRPGRRRSRSPRGRARRRFGAARRSSSRGCGRRRHRRGGRARPRRR